MLDSGEHEEDQCLFGEGNTDRLGHILRVEAAATRMRDEQLAILFSLRSVLRYITCVFIGRL